MARSLQMVDIHELPDIQGEGRHIIVAINYETKESIIVRLRTQTDVNAFISTIRHTLKEAGVMMSASPEGDEIQFRTPDTYRLVAQIRLFRTNSRKRGDNGETDTEDDNQEGTGQGIEPTSVGSETPGSGRETTTGRGEDTGATAPRSRKRANNSRGSDRANQQYDLATGEE